jgi:hypothetical protein
MLVDPFMTDRPLPFLGQASPDLDGAPLLLNQPIHPPPLARPNARGVTAVAPRLAPGLGRRRGRRPQWRLSSREIVDWFTLNCTAVSL